MAELRVKVTADRHGQPLAVVKNLPGLDADMTPAQMRRLAVALYQAAADCESGLATQGLEHGYDW